MFSKRKNEQIFSFTLIQGGLNERSATDILLEEAIRMLSARDIPYDVVDVRSREIDFYDGRPMEKYSVQTHEVIEKMKRASAYIFSVPVYAATVSGAIKNIINLAGQEMDKKVAGIMAGSSGAAPYPATHEFIDFLSNKVHVATVQPVVYASREEFKDGKIFDEQLSVLIGEMIDALLKRHKRD